VIPPSAVAQIASTTKRDVSMNVIAVMTVRMVDSGAIYASTMSVRTVLPMIHARWTAVLQTLSILMTILVSATSHYMEEISTSIGHAQNVTRRVTPVSSRVLMVA